MVSDRGLSSFLRGLCVLFVYACAVFTLACYNPTETELQAAFGEGLEIEGGQTVPVPGGELDAGNDPALFLKVTGPEELSPGQFFNLRLATNHAGPDGITGVLIHPRGSEQAIRIEANLFASPMSVPLLWSFDLYGRVAGDSKLAGRSYDVELALVTQDATIGPIALWSPKIVDDPQVEGCPEAGVCGARVCGREAQCGKPCGDCPSGQSCTLDGLCEPEGDRCPNAARCGERECGPDPVCGVECGTGCGDSETCTVDGRCEADSGDTSDCQPDCGDYLCGLDPTCGTLDCGSCWDGAECIEGRCFCVQACGERECGLDPACSKSCGQCSGAKTCNDQGECVDPDMSDTGSTTTGTTGDTDSQTTTGSAEDTTGSSEGSQTCPDTKDCRDRNCGDDPVCGLPCGDCDTGQKCHDGTCVCAPNCTDRECGLDPTCNSVNCGTCGDGERCENGQCIEDINCPGDMQCQGLDCGPDPVCGESCGMCGLGWACNAGDCECLPVCNGAVCGTEPNCNTVCGTCEADELCKSGQCVTPVCPDDNNCDLYECGFDDICDVECGRCGFTQMCDDHVCVDM